MHSLDTALDLENAITDRYTGKYFMEQMHGMSDATGIDIKVYFLKRKLIYELIYLFIFHLKKLRRIHLIGELT